MSPAHATPATPAVVLEDPEPSNVGAVFAVGVGVLTHRLVQQLAGRAYARPEEVLDRLWEGAAALAGSGGFGRRRTAAEIAIGMRAAVYMGRFLPPAPWRLAGVEVGLPGGRRADLVWEAPEGVLVDEVKSGAPGPAQPGRQVEDLLAGGREAWGERFIGVRVLHLAAAGRSRLYRPGRAPAEVAESGAAGAWPWA